MKTLGYAREEDTQHDNKVRAVIESWLKYRNLFVKVRMRKGER